MHQRPAYNPADTAIKENDGRKNSGDLKNLLTGAWVLSLLSYPLAGLIIGLYLAGFMSLIAEYSYMAINFLLYFHALYHFRSYWNGKMNKTIGVFYLLLLIVNMLIAASIILSMITCWLV